MDKRLQKKWKRENRGNKGVNTEIARLEKNQRIRDQRDRALSDLRTAVMLAALARIGRA